MSENRTDEQIEARNDVVVSPTRRFTVNGFKRVPHAFIPTVSIGALVAIVATVLFAFIIYGK